MSDYEVMTDKEDSERKFKLWENGNYDCTFLDEVTFGTKTIKSEKKLSSNNNPMWIVIAKIFAKDGSDYTITVIDQVMTTGLMRYKHKHLAETLGLKDKYDAETFVIEDIFHKSGQCILEQKPESTDSKTGKVYKAKNGLKDFIPKDSGEEVKDELNDIIPF